MNMNMNMNIINLSLLVIILLVLLYCFLNNTENFSAGSWLGINICQLDKDGACENASNIEELQKLLGNKKKDYSSNDFKKLQDQVKELLKLKEKGR